MSSIEGRDNEAVRQLLIRCWMTHDAMWFANALQDQGIETANRLNLAAIRGMGPIEVARIRKALGTGDIDDAEQLRAFIEGAFELVGGDFMAFEWHWREDGTARVDVHRCFAHDGITKLGAIAAYECGIYERIYTWFEALGIAYTASPPGRQCLLHHQGKCGREFSFEFDQPDKESTP
ncbi:MAG: hypothetical protein QF521_25040 [Alphaproteobacteria bacterium]|nr:hypothetical protein [Alphaproteobacteria bacterium]